MWSDALSEYLKFFKLAQSEKSKADEALADTNEQIQDLLHHLEFEDLKYHEKAKIAIKIEDLRHERRLAKYQIEQTTPIVDWVNKNTAAIHSMEKLLGEIRKAEQHTDPERLSYNYKTSVVQDLLGSKKDA